MRFCAILYLLFGNAGAKMYSQQIKTFVIVAELGSFGKAAEKLGVNPAAVMKQMNALEDRLRLWLLRRCNHGVELTDPGRIIYDVAKKMIGDADSAVLRARAMGATDWHTVRVGSSFLNPARVLLVFFVFLLSLSLFPEMISLCRE